MTYDEIADRRLVQMSDPERDYLTALLTFPSEEFKALVLVLWREGCEFPKQQAALMLRNTPGAASVLLRGTTLANPDASC